VLSPFRARPGGTGNLGRMPQAGMRGAVGAEDDRQGERSSAGRDIAHRFPANETAQRTSQVLGRCPHRSPGMHGSS